MGRFVSIGREVITDLLDTNESIMKMNKLACITEMVLSLDKLDNTDNLEDGRLSNVLLRYHLTGSEEFTCFEPEWGVHFPNPENKGQKG